ncbi:uncharacterized protein LOC113758204 [Coffea eugenioides]|uniref:Uncharacterized protein n=1 Tax=Coffea arabica TaxID=13443 RepID=A0A6P6T4C6_COFAR|nr:uncharacterized protein LOC113697442 [Coffea arabica]XP_027072923.1 uncharacterized protein LOC113697485 [Coffea arabica]XP_027156958.1 uncharacterized protein LOC113758204 [Coffea eugenioides]
MEMNPEIAPYGGALVMVVEYLESSMCRDLLSKFPDNSAFDFDYSQSSIWSPLIHRKFPSTTPISNDRRNVLSCGLSRKLVYNDDEGLTKIKKVTANIKRKFTDAVSDNLLKYQKMRKRKRKNSLDFTPCPSSKLPSTSPTPRKGWVKVLKAASKHFKKKSKKRDSYTQINFSSCFT